MFNKFKRKFSISMFKNLKLKLAEMSFCKDFISDERGDLYPVLSKSDDCIEMVENNKYKIKRGSVKRFVCQFFPYATYEIALSAINGSAGFAFDLPSGKVSVAVSNNEVVCSDGEKEEKFYFTDNNSQKRTMIISCRPGAFDVYCKGNNKAVLIGTLKTDKFKYSNKYTEFSNGSVSLYASGAVEVESVCSYIDNGISIADIRPIRYENGDVMVESGKVYFTVSIRMQEKAFQGVFSWIPSTAEFELSGALFYDSGDGYWHGDVAASILYNRSKGKWYLWVCSFAHDHILGHSEFEGDPRFGINVIDIKLMEKNDSNDITVFKGIEGDEDPDFYYDEKRNKWYMAICRIDSKINSYRYVFFESEKPFDGYKYIGKGEDGAETGGSFVDLNGERVFVCGNDFNSKSNYRIYSRNGIASGEFDYPDGGFRGWGTIVPIKMGSRTRNFWLTFDRHNGSDYNWSYGNLYCFEESN